MGQLYRLVFTSRAALSQGEAGIEEIAAIIRSSRLNNHAGSVSSILALHGGYFAQVMEGSEAAVEAAFARVRRDPRHGNVAAVSRGPVAVRVLAEHPMMLLGDTVEGRRALDRLAATAGGSLAAVAPDALLAALRDIAASERAGSASRQSPVAVAAGAGAGRPEDEALEAVMAFAVFSAEGVALRANANYGAMLGYEDGALAGLSYEALIAPDDLGRLRALWATLSRGETMSLNHRGLRRDGREIWLASTFRPRLDGAGRLRDVVEIAVDQTDKQRQSAENRGQIRAINTSQAVLHLDLDGTILDANALLLEALGYTLDEIRGHNHRILVAPGEAASEDYRAFWADLSAGRHRAGEVRRVGKDGRSVWLQATYNPIFDMNGQPFKVVEFATVVTDAKLRDADYRWQIAAIHKSHAVITFDLNGIILDANDSFLEAVGYALDEVVGRHHRMFVDPSYAHGADYAAFWRELGRGRHQAGQYRRVGRDGREIWLQATYNPVFDVDGHPYKVVKYATVVTEERLRQAEHQGQIAAIHKAQCVISFDLDGTVLDANDNFLDTMNYRLADVRGRPHGMFVDPAEAASAGYAGFWADLAAGRHQAGEYKRIARDGREVWLQATYNPIFDLSGRPFRIVKYATDVTAEKLLRADSDGQIQAIRKSQGVIAFAMDGTILDVNDNMLGTLGYRLEELQGRHHSMLVEPDQRSSAAYAEFWQALGRGDFASGLYKRLGRDGRAVWIQATYNPIFDLCGRPTKIIKFASDVTSQVALAEAYEDAKRQAQHDSATALPNRARLASFMSSALAEPDTRLVVFYIDLDRFKPINDAFGHAVGDRVLGDVADRLRRALSGDQLVARVGGDEFVVVAPDLEDQEIEPFCQRLIASACAPIRHEGGDLRIGLSVGIAVSPADGRTPDDLLRCADAALYRSKEAGRGCYSFYSAAMNDRILSYRSAVDDLRRGLAAGEFVLEYQPRLDARSRKVQSFEALIRWEHPERGRVSPVDFIPLAEKSGLIVEMGRWVMRQACRTAASWDGVGVSVNVSPVQFRSGDLAAMIREALADAGLPSDRLELEITEGVLIENADLAREALAEIKALGVKLAMDDFGTGYSSLSTLRNFPFDVIKIDRQFIADIDARRGGRDVVRAILGLGKALGLSVTAEGVETEQQLKALTADDCDEVQGYLLGRPMRAERVGDLLRDEPDAALDAIVAAYRRVS